ncbi:MAG: inorganic phosphate transporter, partial [Flavobacteriaceae bacterium]|nr:inorganic phosphate transporter [Flavobacteriaceae bacterium]
VVGVSNDAVNFLNSAIGSKAVPFKSIMVIASVGILFGALSSSGMMDIARNGIFTPGKFAFDEVMIIFMAVMITDILLLDFFNSLGLPTSTTVSIVFELLGAAVCISLLKISGNSDTFLDLGNYINTDKASEIIKGILLSVLIAFSVGAIVQYISRLLLTFKFQNKPSWTAAIFGGLATTAISYFIIIKGLKGAQMLGGISAWANENLWQFLVGSILVWSLISLASIKFFKTNVYKVIIILGTFALAMAFAGNDLVNFIGVPMAALEAFHHWESSGLAPTTFTMESLSIPVKTNTYLLLLAGIIMVLTLWFSEKARRVVKTSVDLSRQDEIKERFKSNWLSQNIVRSVIYLNRGFNYVIPNTVMEKLDQRFEQTPKNKILEADAPAFDMVRAAVNLVVASVLISLATGMKLPLSTTYVTFMVAMGSSLADKAWGSDSAVYRVSGVINVILGWFMTAITAFLAAALLAFIIYKFEWFALVTLLILSVVLIARNYLKGRQNNKEIKEELKFKKAESSSVRGVIEESAPNVSTVMRRGSKLLSNTFEELAKQNLKGLKKATLYGEKMTDELDELKNHIFFYIKNLESESQGASRFYLLIQDSLEDIVQSLTFISNTSYKHVKNGHKGLRFNQIRDLKEIEEKILHLFKRVKTEFDANTMENLPKIISEKESLSSFIGGEIEKQIQRTKDPKSSAKNTTLYFSILLECKDIIESTLTLLEQYYIEY